LHRFAHSASNVSTSAMAGGGEEPLSNVRELDARAWQLDTVLRRMRLLHNITEAEYELESREFGNIALSASFLARLAVLHICSNRADAHDMRSWIASHCEPSMGFDKWDRETARLWAKDAISVSMGVIEVAKGSELINSLKVCVESGRPTGLSDADWKKVRTPFLEALGRRDIRQRAWDMMRPLVSKAREEDRKQKQDPLHSWQRLINWTGERMEELVRRSSDSL